MACGRPALPFGPVNVPMRLACLIAVVVAAFLLQDMASAAAADRAPARDFDFYVLSLSWSPSWCATHPEGKKTAQCDPDRNFGFIVHGLWPQNESGYPQFCPTREPDRIPDRLGRQYLDIIPSMGLIGHEWRKHGVCSGLDQASYFRTLRAAFDKINIPPALSNLDKGRLADPALLEKAFVAANPGMQPTGIAVSCSAHKLQEIRICLTKALGFRDCPEVDADACPLKSIEIPPVP